MNDNQFAQFEIPGMLEVIPGVNELPKVVLTHRSGARAEVYLHGGHVTSWTTPGGEELFFLSRSSYFALDKPIRGGIPVAFPQFGGGPLPQHGIARISDWQPIRTGVRDSGEVMAALQLTADDDTRELWPHRFNLVLEVLLDATRLTVALQVDNVDKAPFDFNAVLHTYFSVGAITRTAVEGLRGVTYQDSLRDDVREVEQRDTIRFDAETDRIYLDAPPHLRVVDETNARVITLDSQDMPDAVVWNPWIAKAQRMPDFGDDEYREMVCVETGIMVTPRTLAPGQHWRGETVFGCEPSS